MGSRRVELDWVVFELGTVVDMATRIYARTKKGYGAKYNEELETLQKMHSLFEARVAWDHSQHKVFSDRVLVRLRQRMKAVTMAKNNSLIRAELKESRLARAVQKEMVKNTKAVANAYQVLGLLRQPKEISKEKELQIEAEIKYAAEAHIAHSTGVETGGLMAALQASQVDDPIEAQRIRNKALGWDDLPDTIEQEQELTPEQESEIGDFD